MILFNFLNAHKINLFISNEKNTIDIYSYFANGAACKNCTLKIKNKDKIIVHDKLDNFGQYQYESKFKTLEVIIDATGGHKISEKIEITNMQKENLEEHMEEESDLKDRNIILGLILIALIFFILKKVKR